MVDVSKVSMNEDGYLIDEKGNRVVFYVCDPDKNQECPKTMCRYAAGNENEALFGMCATTPIAAYRKADTKAFYKKLNEDGYFGREYI